MKRNPFRRRWTTRSLETRVPLWLYTWIKREARAEDLSVSRWIADHLVRVALKKGAKPLEEREDGAPL